MAKPSPCSNVSVSFDTGALSSHVASSSMYLHELFHDGRHLLGVPCH